MKNPFVMMALMAAAMSEAFKENAYRNAGIPLPTGRGRSRIAGKAHPAGSKFFVRAFKAKHGYKPDSVAQAREWYSAYLVEKDAAARAVEARKRQQRAERNAAPLKLAA